MLIAKKGVKMKGTSRVLALLFVFTLISPLAGAQAKSGISFKEKAIIISTPQVN